MNSKKFAFLDGIRGIAAIFVLSRHTNIFWQTGFFRSYLAVDLFFILSGFVIAYAYDEKLRTGTMSFRDFVVTRVIRLYPVFLLSVVLCAILMLGKHFMPHRVGEPDLAHIGLVIFFAALFLPVSLAGNTNLFPLNGPYWSIFFELIANFVYAILRPFLSIKNLLAILLISGVFLVITAVTNGNLNIGFSWGALSLIGGFARSIFGIFLGILLFRQKATLLAFFNKIFRKGFSPWLAVAIIAASLASPSAYRLDPLIDLLLITLVFPVLVLYLAEGSTAGKTNKFEKVLLMLGSASYPIYVLHVPVAQFLSFGAKGIIEKTAPVSGIVLVALMIALSLLVEKKFDIPMRRWLTKTFNSKSKKATAKLEPLGKPSIVGVE